jgi:FkbM family methyltransferase
MVKDLLRASRGRIGDAIGATVAAFPRLEPAFVRAGRAVAAHRLLSTLYWASAEGLLGRLRGTDRRFRRVPMAGTPLWLDITDGTARMLYFHGEPYEPQVVDALAALLRPGDVFMDVGANIGFFSLIASRLVGEAGRVIAFEPHPDALARFHDLMTANGGPPVVEVVATAVGAASRESVQLFLSSDSVLSTLDPAQSPARGHFRFDRSLSVGLISLDQWLADRPELLARLRLIKIDVEGAEAQVVDGMRQTLRHNRGVAVICETDPGGATDLTLRREGYAPESLGERTIVGNYIYRHGTQPATRPC